MVATSAASAAGGRGWRPPPTSRSRSLAAVWVVGEGVVGEGIMITAMAAGRGGIIRYESCVSPPAGERHAAAATTRLRCVPSTQLAHRTETCHRLSRCSRPARLRAGVPALFVNSLV